MRSITLLLLVLLAAKSSLAQRPMLPATPALTTPAAFVIDSIDLFVDGHTKEWRRMISVPAFKTTELTTTALPNDKGVVYGQFWARLGLYRTEEQAHLLNLSTGQFYSLTMRPTLRSVKTNIFCYALPPGRYVLVNYEYMQMTTNGGSTSRATGYESIRKRLTQSPNDLPTAATRFLFTVMPGQLQYVGTWHFERPHYTRFTDDLTLLNALLKTNHEPLPVDRAVTTLPQ